VSRAAIFFLFLFCALLTVTFVLYRRGFIHIFVILPVSQKNDIQKIELPYSHLRTVSLYYETPVPQKKQLVIPANLPLQESIHKLITAWLAWHHKQQLIAPYKRLEAAIFNVKEHTIYLSFSHPLWSKEASIQDKWLLIENMCSTLRTLCSPHMNLILLSNHTVTHDNDIDLRQPWPLCGFKATSAIKSKEHLQKRDAFH